MYREKPTDDPITAAEILALWWRKRGDTIIGWLVVIAVAVSASGIVRSCESRSARQDAEEHVRWLEVSKGACRDYSYSIEHADSATCPRPDQRLTFEGLWAHCKCKDK